MTAAAPATERQSSPYILRRGSLRAATELVVHEALAQASLLASMLEQRDELESAELTAADEHDWQTRDVYRRHRVALEDELLAMGVFDKEWAR